MDMWKQPTKMWWIHLFYIVCQVVWFNLTGSFIFSVSKSWIWLSETMLFLMSHGLFTSQSCLSGEKLEAITTDDSVSLYLHYKWGLCRALYFIWLSHTSRYIKLLISIQSIWNSVVQLICSFPRYCLAQTDSR